MGPDFHFYIEYFSEGDIMSS